MSTPDKFYIWKTLAFFTLLIVRFNCLNYSLYASSCTDESSTRVCPQKDNITEYLMSIKKGGTNILSPNDYDKNFFLCEEYTFDCGYVEDDAETVSISNGIQLKMNATQVDSVIPSNASLASNIKKYINLPAPDAKCGMKIFPLLMTAAQSDLFFTNYMAITVNDIRTKYTAQKMNGTRSWASLNINIKTAVSEAIKEDKNLMYSAFWENFKANNFIEMSNYLKAQFRKTNQLYYLRSAYLIDSVSKKCDRYQSISFLIDESGSITAPNFQLALDFLSQYVNSTFDDPKLTSIHFYDSSFESYLDFGKTKTQLTAGIQAKGYRAGGTYTGDAINKTIAKISAANFDKGVNKILIVFTDGKSYDPVLAASNYAREKSITMIAVGIGSAVNDTQLLEIAQTPSNVIKVTAYSELIKLVDFIENFFCKQIIDLRVDETIVGNIVRTVESPAYFRVQKSPSNQSYELHIRYDTNPDSLNTSVFTSEYDPFPDEFSQFNISVSYRPSILERVYFVSPTKDQQIRVKKELKKTQSFANSYLSVGGSNIKFNISLNPCKSPECTAEKASYQMAGSMKDANPLASKDYNIYGIIAGSIAGLLCLSLLGALAVKKLTGEKQQQDPNSLQDNKLQPEITEQDIRQNDEIQSQASNKSGNSHKSGNSNKSGKSNESHKSNKSQKSDKKKGHR